jgi:c-di-GMP phosphodiesterase
MLGTLVAGSIGGAAILVALLTWYLWRESVVAEETRSRALARDLGEQVEATIIDARNTLDKFNRLEHERCSVEHLQLLQEAAITRPYIRAIGYWRAANRLCGAGFVQGNALTPPHADKIYESGVIAWWPGPNTRIGDVELFLMRYGDHDIAIDPKLLLTGIAIDGQRAGLWVEGLRMASLPAGADLPEPDSVPVGLTVDRENGRILSRFSLGELLPIDIVVEQPMAHFWQRYLPTLVIATVVGVFLLLIWTYAMLRFSRHHLSLATELRYAVQRGQIYVDYQPIVDLASGRCVGAESLARWRRSNGEMMSPEVFIPTAESSGFISELTLTVLRRILEDMGDLLRNNPGLSINLNLSSQDLENAELSARLASALKQANVAASSIALEITERDLVNKQLSAPKISALRSAGHPVAIDDFGTGYSSLSYLDSFELDTLKIDKIFVDTITRNGEAGNHENTGVIGHIIEMGRAMKLKLVAEGIECAHQQDWLLQRGVDFGQGYLFARPMTAREFRRFLNNHDGALGNFEPPGFPAQQQPK